MKFILLAVCSITVLSAAEVKLGKPLTLKEPVGVSALLASPSGSVGKTVQVKGKITEVCQMAGCWMQIAGDGGASIRIKVNDGDIEFPKDAAGKTAIAEGKLSRIELTREQAVAQARHEAEEMGRKFDAAKVKAQTVYQIEGTGAVILQ